MTRVALATCTAHPNLYADEAGLRAALEARGAQVSAVSWDDAHADWSRFHHVVVRNTWDYHQHPPKVFLDWIAARGAGPARLHNPAPVVRWNLDKRYLLELPGAIPTLFATSDGEREAALAEALRRRWLPLVLKPAYSAGGRSTTVAHDAEAAARDLRDLEPGTVLLQRLVPEITTGGELSLIYVGGVYSHAVVKRAAPGEFRIHQRYGGTVEPVEPSAEVRAAADRALAAAPGPTTYARVDGVVSKSGFAIMELELVEPELFLRFHPPAAEALAAQILARAEASVEAGEAEVVA